MIEKLSNAIQHYEWGSPDRLYDLLGLPRGDKPGAELWMGVHPTAPSQTSSGPLPELIASNPVAALGGHAPACNNQLPYLFKVLAAAKPLSLQAHPDAQAAAVGFRREEKLGIPRTAHRRLYRDPSAKPELVVALEPFQVLVGFRSPEEIAHRLQNVEVPALRGLIETVTNSGVKEFFQQLLRSDPEQHRKICRQVGSVLGDTIEHQWVDRLLNHYPDDATALAPLFLQYLELQPGEGLFLDPGVVHSYLGGMAIEVMGNSDNVLRAGLTTKHVDVDELLAVARYDVVPLSALQPQPGNDGWQHYSTAAAEFSLATVEVSAPVERRRDSDGGEIVLCTKGSVQVIGDATRVSLERGDAVFVGQTRTCQFSGFGTLWSCGPGNRALG